MCILHVSRQQGYLKNQCTLTRPAVTAVPALNTYVLLQVGAVACWLRLPPNTPCWSRPTKGLTPQCCPARLEAVQEGEAGSACHAYTCAACRESPGAAVGPSCIVAVIELHALLLMYACIAQDFR